MMKKTIKKVALTLSTVCLAHNLQAAEISTNTAIMQAMDKITGQVSLIEVPVNQEVLFGSFSILVRECKTRTPEEAPENFAFVDVVDTTGDKGQVNIFKGWMLSSSPALNPLAHPVYDVWLLKCVNKMIDPKLQMSAEQLVERDTIQMSRQKAVADTRTDEVGEIENRTTGEPLNLIPESIEDTIAEEKVQSEAIKIENRNDDPSEALHGEKTSTTDSEIEIEPTAPTITNTENKNETTTENQIEVSVEDKTATPTENKAEIIPEAIKNPPLSAQQPLIGEPEALIVIPEEDLKPSLPIQNADYEVIEDNNSAPTDNTQSATLQVEPSSAKEVTTAPLQTDSEENIIQKLEQELSAKVIGE